MASYNETFILLKKPIDPKAFLLGFHQKLKALSCVLEKDDSNFISFNDARNGEEKEILYLNETMSDSEIIEELYSWKALGCLSFRHPDFSFELTIDYRTWDDKNLYGFNIAFNNKDVLRNREKHRLFIFEISNAIDYKYIVGDIYPDSNTYLNLALTLDAIEEMIRKQKFEIDYR